MADNNIVEIGPSKYKGMRVKNWNVQVWFHGDTPDEDYFFDDFDKCRSCVIGLLFKPDVARYVVYNND